MTRRKPTINTMQIRRYLNFLKEQERSEATLSKYEHDLVSFCNYLQNGDFTKAALIDWKQLLISQYAPATVNSMLAVVNGYLRFMGLATLCVKLLKVQRSLFLDEKKELTKADYARLVHTAQRQKNERLSLVIQTICATGIRVSELKFITAEAVYSGRAEIINKGKRRLVFLPEKLRRLLKATLRKQKKTAGAVFTTRSGKPLDRSNIWRDMKALCKSAYVAPEKVFPHNLRHLFARTFYGLEKDLSRLADVLGHSSINTTRIYTAESGSAHEAQMARLGLVIT